MFNKNKKTKEVEVEVVEERSNVTIHEDRWDKTTNQLVSDELPSLND